MLSSGLGTPLPPDGQEPRRSTSQVCAEQRLHASRGSTTCSADWVVTKHVYVAPTDAQAQAEAHEPEMWYRDAFIRSLSADDLAGWISRSTTAPRPC